MSTIALTETSSGDCGCAAAGASSELVGLERTHFYSRQLVGADDLSQDQTYFRAKARRHNRLLHGWGIVCGAGVTAGAKPCEVVVAPGYILGPYGDEIVIDREVTFDVCSQRMATDACHGVDPWCTDVRTRPREGQPLYLAVRATECDTRPVRVTACGCGCDADECEYSRIRDSFELTVLTELPDDYRRKPVGPDGLLLFASLSCLTGPPSCPPCPDSPWVVLADLTIDADEHVTPTGLHRRYVASFARYYFQCKPTDSAQMAGLGTAVGGATRADAYVDPQSLEEIPDPSAPPAEVATVAAKRGDGSWITVHGAFAVARGETLRAMLAREGDRTLVDVDTGETVTVRELFASVAADPAAEVRNVADALSHLEGRTLDVAGLRVVRDAYSQVLDRHGLERLDDAFVGAPRAAPQLPATGLRGVQEKSPVGRYLAGKTIAEVAAEARSDFVAAATKGLKGAQLKREAGRAGTVWDSARRVARLGAAWRDPSPA